MRPPGLDPYHGRCYSQHRWSGSDRQSGGQGGSPHGSWVPPSGSQSRPGTPQPQQQQQRQQPPGTEPGGSPQRGSQPRGVQPQVPQQGSTQQGGQPRPGTPQPPPQQRQPPAGGTQQQTATQQGGSRPGSSPPPGSQPGGPEQGGTQPGGQPPGATGGGAETGVDGWRWAPYEVIDAAVKSGVTKPLPVGPPQQDHTAVELMVELQGVPVDQRTEVIGQLLSHGQPLARITYSISPRHLRGDNAALIVQCKPEHELRALGIDATSEAASLRSGPGLQVELPGPGGGRPARVRLPVRAVPRERPPRCATLKILGLQPRHAVSGLTQGLLECAGYVTPGALPQIKFEYMALWRGTPFGRSDVIIAYVECPADDPALRLLPRQFSMGSHGAKIEVLPAFERAQARVPAGAFASAHGSGRMGEEVSGQAARQVPEGGVAPSTPVGCPRRTGCYSPAP